MRPEWTSGACKTENIYWIQIRRREQTLIIGMLLMRLVVILYFLNKRDLKNQREDSLHVFFSKCFHASIVLLMRFLGHAVQIFSAASFPVCVTGIQWFFSHRLSCQLLQKVMVYLTRGVNTKGFYLRLYLIALRTFLQSSLDIVEDLVWMMVSSFNYTTFMESCWWGVLS